VAYSVIVASLILIAVLAAPFALLGVVIAYLIVTIGRQTGSGK